MAAVFIFLAARTDSFRSIKRLKWLPYRSGRNADPDSIAAAHYAPAADFSLRLGFECHRLRKSVRSCAPMSWHGRLFARSMAARQECNLWQ
jgi:hypothetical protein